MSNSNVNTSNLDARYSKPTDVASAISTQATTDAGLYQARKGFQTPLARDFPGMAGLMSVNTSLGTIVMSAPNASTSITNSTTLTPSRTRFRPVNSEVKTGTTYPDYLGWNAWPWQYTSGSPYAVEFDLDTLTGVFEIRTKGNGMRYNVAINGQYLTTTGVTNASDGQGYLITVTIAAGAGQYRVRVELSTGEFWGINVGPTDGAIATPRKGPRMLLIGDSFAEPTIADTAIAGNWMGYPTLLGHLTGWEIVNAGSGGTGLVATNSGLGRPNYLGRINDFLTYPNVDGFLVQLSGNDNGFSPSSVITNLTAFINALKTGGYSSYGQIIVLASWNNKDAISMQSSHIDTNFQAQALCVSMGIPFVDTFLPIPENGMNTTLAAVANSGTSSITVPTKGSSYEGMGSGADNYVVIGNPNGSREVRRVTSISGSGPYTLSLTPALANSHGVGEVVIQTGPSLLTGGGNLSSPTGSGTADRYTGTDGTHPSILGHRARAIQYAERLQHVLPR